MSELKYAKGAIPAARAPESATRGTILLSAGRAATAVSSTAIYIVAGRALLIEAYGRFVIVFVALMWMGVVTQSLVLPGLRKIVSEDAGRLPAALSFALRWHSAVALVLSLAVCVSAPALSRLFADPELTLLLLLVGLQVPLVSTVKLAFHLLVGVRHYSWAACVLVVNALGRALGTCLLLLLGFGAAAAVGGLFAGSVAAAGASGALLLKERRHLPLLPYPPMARRTMYWSSVSFPTMIALATLMTIDMWLVKGIVQDHEAAGIYAVAYAVSRFPMFIVFGLNGAVFPRVSAELTQGDAKAARRVASEAMRFLLVLFAPICAILAASSSEIISFTVTQRYAEAAQPLAVLGPAIYCAAQMHLACQLLAAANRPGTRLILMLGLLPLAVASNVALIPRLGILGAASASLVTFGVGAAAGTALAYRLLGAAPRLRTILHCALGGAIVYAVSSVWAVSGRLLLGKLGVLGLLYLALLFGLGELRRGNLAAIWRNARLQPESRNM